MKWQKKSIFKKIQTIILMPVFGLLKAYQYLLRPWLGQQCRFYPSCSDYSLLAFKRLGFWLGGFYTIYRLCRCQPYNSGGFDWPPKHRYK